MATTKQVQAAETNVKKAQAAAKRKRTVAHLPVRTRKALQQQARRGRERGGEAGHALEDRNREQLYELAKKKQIRGRSKMGKGELIDALRRAVLTLLGRELTTRCGKYRLTVSHG
jgi:hypothetical protein